MAALTVSGGDSRLPDLGSCCQALKEHMDAHLMSVSIWASFLRLVCRHFCWLCPVGGVLGYSFVMSSSLRAMVFACEVLGGLLLTSVVFMASGGAQSRRSKGDCTVTGVWENLGRLIAIAAASTVLAGVPCSFIPSLHTRGYKKWAPNEWLTVVTSGIGARINSFRIDGSGS